MKKIEVHNRCSDYESYRAARVKSLFNAEPGQVPGFFFGIVVSRALAWAHTGQQFSAQSGSCADLRIGTLKTHGFA